MRFGSDSITRLSSRPYGPGDSDNAAGGGCGADPVYARTSASIETMLLYFKYAWFRVSHKRSPSVFWPASRIQASTANTPIVKTVTNAHVAVMSLTFH